MKNLLLFLFIILTTSLFAQKSTLNVEAVIASDSVKTQIYKSITQGYKKAPVNMRVDKQSCPVFIDDEGYMFFIKIEDGSISIVEIDLD